MKQKVVIGLLLFTFTQQAQAVSLVSGSGTAAAPTTTFATQVLCNAYHQPSKTWFVGMEDGNTTYEIAKVGSSGNFSAVALNAATDDNCIRHLGLSHNTASVHNPLVIFTATADTTIEPTTLFSLVSGDTTALQVVDSNGDDASINDFSGTTATDSIRALATGNSYAFAAVKDNGTADPTTFGNDNNDGIALMTIDHDTKKLTVTNATDAAVGNKALNTIAATLNITEPPATLDGDVTLHWSERLQRLYVGMQATTENIDNHLCYGLLIYRVAANNILTAVPPITTPAINTATINTKIIAAESGGAGAASIALLKLDTMYTSTGLDYLIVNGGNAAADSVKNLVYALPLVYTAADTDNNNGSLADIDFAVNAPVIGTGFDTKAADLSDVYSNVTATHPQAAVGGGALPIANAPTAGVSDMKVIGDTVYCAVYSAAVNATNAPGIYYSQAIFDNTGAIARWTDWAKAAPFAIGNSTTDGASGHFAVDATTGNIIGTDNTTNTIINRTDWTASGTATTSLVATLNSNLSGGCFSVFDLNQSTRNFGTVNDAFNRYALFGGRGKVVFTKISLGRSAAYLAPQTMITDFSDIDNIKETTLPNDTAPVTVLGYSKWADDGNKGFFFAGTRNGLYVFAATGGAGFDPDNFANLDEAPFTTFSWQKLTDIAGEPRAIKCVGQNVYILTRDTTKLTTLTTTATSPSDKLYGIAAKQDIDDFVVLTLATSGDTAPLDNATLFHDFEIVTAGITNSVTDEEQIILSTNDGLYLSRETSGIQGATTEAEADWLLIADPATDTKIYDHLTAPTHTRVPQIVWASEWLDNSNGDGVWTFSGLRQIGASVASTPTIADVPDATFNSDSSTVFTRLSPIKKFWSDGARRFYIGVSTSSDGTTNELFTLPFNVGSSYWNVSGERIISNDAIAQSHNVFHWVQAIGATGNIMAGTDKGVISLE